MPLVRPRRRIEDDDAFVQLAIGHEHFVRQDVHPDLGGVAERGRVAAAAVSSRHANLQQELAGTRELEDVRVLVIRVAANPHIVLAIHGDPVRPHRPHIAVAWAAPCLNDGPRRVEFDDRWGR